MACLVQLNRQDSITAVFRIAKVNLIRPAHFSGQNLAEKKSIHANALKDMASRKGNLAFSTRGNSDRRDGASDSRFDSQYSESSPRQLSPNRGTPRSTGSYDRDEAIPPLNGDYRSLPSNISPQNQASLLFNAPNPYTPSGGQRDRWSP